MSAAHARRRRYPWRRYLLAQWRDVRVLTRQFSIPLVLLTASVLLGGLFFNLLYTNAEFHDLSYVEAVYAIYSMIFFGESVPFPSEWYLQIFYFIMPIIGLGLIAQGVIQFGVMLFNKSAREGEWQVAIASTYRDHIVVAGIGRLGYRIVRELLDFGEDVVGIEIDPQCEFVARVTGEHVPVLFGNAARLDVLRQAGVERAVSIVPCTENDLTNLEIALVARELKPDIHVVLRMFDHDMAQKVARGFNIQTAFSTSALAAPAFARAATRADISHAFYVGDELLNVSEMTVRPGSTLVGSGVCDLEKELDFSIILHARDGNIDLHPAPDTVLQAGDRLCVFASLDVLNRLTQLNRTGGI
ncbi:MAG TPA: TrkA family potassium uptake protein [Anaerolineae bacterium]|nr:TrkA family potassium uptake protein [Anaerolineae bacterium]